MTPTKKPNVIVKRRKLKDYKPDPANVNRGSPRGQQLIVDSLKELGAGRSVLADADDVLIAGNHTVEAAIAAGLVEAIEIEAPPDALVVVKRKDMSLANDQKARRMALADNRTQQTNLDFDPAGLLADTALLDGFWRDDEIAELMDAAKSLEGVDMALDNEPEGNRLTGGRKMQIKPVLYVEQVATFEQALAATGLPNRAEALMEICRAYMEGKHAG